MLPRFYGPTKGAKGPIELKHTGGTMLNIVAKFHQNRITRSRVIMEQPTET